MDINTMSEQAHEMAVAKGFWDGYSGNISFGADLTDINYICMKLVLVHAELSEAVEALRQHDCGNFKEEIADTFIRLGDIVGAIGIDISAEIVAKMARNAKRPYQHGKRF